MTEEEKKASRKKSAREYYYRNKEKYRQYRQENKEMLYTARKRWAQENKEKRRKSSLEYKRRNEDKVGAYKKEYQQRNKDKINKRYQEYLESNPSKKIPGRLRHRISEAIKHNGGKKSRSLIYLIGCDIEFLKQHLEKQFKPGMTWENYGRGGWHIDHIVPCCLFDLSKEWQQKSCFKWENLQPLWEWENYRKNGKLETCPV